MREHKISKKVCFYGNVFWGLKTEGIDGVKNILTPLYTFKREVFSQHDDIPKIKMIWTKILTNGLGKIFIW